MSTQQQTGAYSTAQIMLMLQAMSRDVAVLFSEYTGQWYVDARRLAVGDGCMAASTAEHRDTPDLAVRAIFERLTSIGLDEYVIGEYQGERREYRWNGAAFAEVTRPEVLASRTSRSGD
jgi:hypothetical protein